MRRQDWADDWSEELMDAFREHALDEELIAQTWQALLDAYEAGRAGRSLFATNCDAANKHPRGRRR